MLPKVAKVLSTLGALHSASQNKPLQRQRR
jgi:hypothetical protein